MAFSSSSAAGVFPMRALGLLTPWWISDSSDPLVSPRALLILGQGARVFNFLLKKRPESADLLPSAGLAPIMQEPLFQQ